MNAKARDPNSICRASKNAYVRGGGEGAPGRKIFDFSKKRSFFFAHKLRPTSLGFQIPRFRAFCRLQKGERADLYTPPEGGEYRSRLQPRFPVFEGPRPPSTASGNTLSPRRTQVRLALRETPYFTFRAGLLERGRVCTCTQQKNFVLLEKSEIFLASLSAVSSHDLFPLHNAEPPLRLFRRTVRTSTL